MKNGRISKQEYQDIEKKHVERISFLRSKLIRGDWQKVIKICKAKGIEISDTPHAINIIKSTSAKKHIHVYKALESVIEERINQFK